METRLTYNCAHIRSTKASLVVLGQWKAVLVGTWWNWVTMERNWLIHDGTGSLECSTGWNSVVLGQKKPVLVSTK